MLAVLRDGRGAIGSDGQVTLGDTAVKHGAVKVRSLRDGKVLAGFAGGAADALTLSEKFEGHLDRYQGHLRRATVELAREWRQDRILRRLEAMMIVMDRDDIFTVSGNGDILEAEQRRRGDRQRRRLRPGGGARPASRTAPSTPPRSAARRSRSPATSASTPTAASRS